MDPITFSAITAIMGISCGLVAIIGGYIIDYHKKKNETQVRESIITNNVDPELAKMLIEPLKKRDKYSILHWGFILVGLGLGYVTTLVFGVSGDNEPGFWIILAVGVGFGLLASFFVKNMLEAKARAQKEDNDTEVIEQ